MKKIIFLILGLALIIWSLFTFINQPYIKESRVIPRETSSLERETRTIKINDAIITAELADNPILRARGLSNRMNLEEGTGMFFIFENAGRYGFWMKGMNFAIDIIWIDEKLTVVDLDQNIRKETFPHIFYPEKDVKYVLEVPSGFIDKYKIEVGDMVE